MIKGLLNKLKNWNKEERSVGVIDYDGSIVYLKYTSNETLSSQLEQHGITLEGSVSIGRDVLIGEGSVIAKEVILGHNTVINKNVYIGESSEIYNSDISKDCSLGLRTIIGSGCRLASGVVLGPFVNLKGRNHILEDAVIERGCVLLEGASVIEDVRIAGYNTLGKFETITEDLKDSYLYLIGD